MSQETETNTSHEHTLFMRWKYTWYGRVTWAVLDLVIAYVFGSLAIDSGSLWQWGVTALFLVDGIYNFIQFIRKLTRGRQATKA